MHWWVAVGPCHHCLACSRRRLRKSEMQSVPPNQQKKAASSCLRGNNAQWLRLCPTNRRSAPDACCTKPRRRLACSNTRNQDRCRWPIWVISAPDGTLSRRRQHKAPYGRPSPSNSDRMKSRIARKTKWRLPMAAFLLVAAENTMTKHLLPIRQELSEFHLWNYGTWAQLKSRGYPVTGSKGVC